MNLNINIQQILAGLLFSLSVILMPIKGFMLIMLFAVIIDTITGIAASIKQRGYSSLVSNKYFNVPIKLFFYWAVIFMFYYIDVHVFNAKLLDVELLLAKSVTVIFLYIEAKSFNENQAVFSGKPLEVWLREMYTNLKKIKKDFTDLTQ